MKKSDSETASFSSGLIPDGHKIIQFLSKITDYPIPIFDLRYRDTNRSVFVRYVGILMIFRQELTNAA